MSARGGVNPTFFGPEVLKRPNPLSEYTLMWWKIFGHCRFFHHGTKPSGPPTPGQVHHSKSFSTDSDRSRWDLSNEPNLDLVASILTKISWWNAEPLVLYTTLTDVFRGSARCRANQQHVLLIISSYRASLASVRCRYYDSMLQELT